MQKDNSLMNYEDILNSISSSVAQEDIRELIDKNIYNINFSSESVSFDLDFQNLSEELYRQNFNFNLTLLNCSLNKNFFSLNSNINECPQFKQKTINKKKYLYVSSLRAGSLYTYELNDDFDKILEEDRIYFHSKRIRDLKYDKDTGLFFIIFEFTPSIAVLTIL